MGSRMSFPRFAPCGGMIGGSDGEKVSGLFVKMSGSAKRLDTMSFGVESECVGRWSMYPGGFGLIVV